MPPEPAFEVAKIHDHEAGRSLRHFQGVFPGRKHFDGWVNCEPCVKPGLFVSLKRWSEAIVAGNSAFAAAKTYNLTSNADYGCLKLSTVSRNRNINV